MCSCCGPQKSHPLWGRVCGAIADGVKPGEAGCAIVDHPLVAMFPWERFSHLLQRPVGGGVGRHVRVKYSPAA
ncbi:MAG: hypothetical protein GY820_10810 [Gammaproteobacteria bacterium]|nr:hypothetical protein [Gammaproteobacteria bacterium]